MLCYRVCGYMYGMSYMPIIQEALRGFWEGVWCPYITLSIQRAFRIAPLSPRGRELLPHLHGKDEGF